ncbi:hypothetical protein PanWU01x14_347260 [Parasponia andersonii]|uniref:Uncharacterized protein n=1 Tax=Parasponia andersonii TaxID=3476 RepID=A0A2P5AC35_PARAD|nr:hypothetical protein PanWU01x14_347260 [Parasponia andersonii]
MLPVSEFVRHALHIARATSHVRMSLVPATYVGMGLGRGHPNRPRVLAMTESILHDPLISRPHHMAPHYAPALSQLPSARVHAYHRYAQDMLRVSVLCSAFLVVVSECCPPQHRVPQPCTPLRAHVWHPTPVLMCACAGHVQGTCDSSVCAVFRAHASASVVPRNTLSAQVAPCALATFRSTLGRMLVHGDDKKNKGQDLSVARRWPIAGAQSYLLLAAIWRCNSRDTFEWLEIRSKKRAPLL